MDVPAAYADLIEQIGEWLGIPYGLIHVHVGLLIYFGASILLRARLGTPLPLIVVAGAEIANELLDRLHWNSWRWGDTLGDVANTLIWPTAVFLFARWWIQADADSSLRRAAGDAQQE